MLDPDKFVELWGVDWWQLEDGFGEPYDEDEYRFDLGKGREFKFNLCVPNEISIGSINFYNITRVVYARHRSALALESVNEKFFSQVYIPASGEYRVDINKPIKLHQASICEVLTREMNEE